MAEDDVIASSNFGLDPSDESIPSTEDFLKALDGMDGLDAETVKHLRDSILSGGKGALKNLLSSKGIKAEPAADPYQLLKLLALVFLILLVLGEMIFYEKN